MPITGRSLTRVRGFDDAEMDYQLLRLLGTAATGGCSVGQGLHLASQIVDGDPDSWCDVFRQAAGATQDGAATHAREGNDAAATTAWFHANQLWRAAEFWAQPADRMRADGLAAHECFVQAATRYAAAAKLEFTEIAVPFNAEKLPGYRFAAPRRQGSTPPTVIMMNGSDGTSEETFFWAGRAAAERGYALVLIDGPGQTGAMRFNPASTFRPDTEAPLGAVIDHVRSTWPATGPIVLFGFSFGGYMVTRAASRLPEVAAVIASPPLLDLSATLGNLITDDGKLTFATDVTVAQLDQLPGMSRVFRRDVAIHCRKFGVGSIKALLDRLPDYHIAATDLAAISCPGLALVGAGEGSAFADQARQFAAGIKGPATLHAFDAASGADAHCQVGNPDALAAVAYGWLAKVLRA